LLKVLCILAGDFGGEHFLARVGIVGKSQSTVGNKILMEKISEWYYRIYVYLRRYSK
jgi:hypothetical protein